MPDHPTEVMSLDELMNLAAEPRGDTTTQPMRPASATAAAPAPALPPVPTPAPAPLNPAVQRPVRAEPDLRERVMSDARQAFDAGLARSRDWLNTGDNTLITATLVVTLLLLLVVAAL